MVTTDQPITIVPEALYTDESLQQLLGIGPGHLAAARRSGALRFVERGGRRFYAGRAVRQWLEMDGNAAE